MAEKMSERQREKFYDKEIAPALQSLADKCREHGLSMLAVVEWSPGEYGRTYTQVPSASFGLRLAEVAAQANGNVDALIFALMKHGREHGHNSMVLHQLGVPSAPAVSGDIQ